MLLPVLVALQVGVQPALAWAWPVDGPVLRPFVLGDDPYAGGQHRGIDIGAPSGTPVRAPAAGTVSFAGTVPTGGKTISIRTEDGYAVTLLHLGTYSVSRGDAVAEGDVLGSVGGSGHASGSTPYVYLGIRRAEDPNGYVDPLGLLPAPAPAPQDPVPADPVPNQTPDPGPGSKHHSPASTPHPVSVQTPSAASQLARRVPNGVEGRGEPRASKAQSRSGRFAHTGRPAVARPVHAPSESVSAVGAAAAPEQSRDFQVPWLWALPAAAVLALALGSARRRQLDDAGTADGASAVLAESASFPAEDADRLRLGQQDGFVLDRDLERILLAKGKALPDLDRNHDPAEVVDVADDARFRCSPGRARLRGSFNGSVRPHRLAFRSRSSTWNTSPGLAVSNHQLRVRSRMRSFV
jgi:hypothetical protein